MATVTLNRPKVHNAWDDSLGDGMSRIFSDLASRDDVRVVVLTGAGRSFCSGADLVTGFPQLPSGHDDLRTTLRERFHPAFLALLDLPQPVIAAVHGPAIGAGACLALASDIAIMGPEAFLQFRFTAIGLMPDVGATALLASAVGVPKAIEILMLAERLGPRQCLELGLVSRLSEGDPREDAVALARRLANGPTRAYAMTKKAVRQWAWRDMASHLEVEARLQQTLIATEDWREGRAAFIERREPQFRGR
jgi:2-(1,2-epoxy-1,2-dihydrophenyl)acetyl-CoA isomerase